MNLVLKVIKNLFIKILNDLNIPNNFHFWFNMFNNVNIVDLLLTVLKGRTVVAVKVDVYKVL